MGTKRFLTVVCDICGNTYKVKNTDLPTELGHALFIDCCRPGCTNIIRIILTIVNGKGV